MQLYNQNPLEIFFFIFTIYQNYTLALKKQKQLTKYLIQQIRSAKDMKIPLNWSWTTA